MWGNFISSVHMTSGGVKLTSVQISLRSNWPKWNFKPQWVFHVNIKCPQWNVLLLLFKKQPIVQHLFCIKFALIKRYHLHMCNRVLLLFGKLPQWNLHENCHVNGTALQSGLRFQTSLSSLRVSCKCALIVTFIMVKAQLAK